MCYLSCSMTILICHLTLLWSRIIVTRGNLSPGSGANTARWMNLGILDPVPSAQSSVLPTSRI